MSGEQAVRLTAHERDSLILAFFDQDHACAHNMVPVYEEVERILARRLTPPSVTAMLAVADAAAAASLARVQEDQR